MAKYLMMSPDCQELFHMLEAEDKPTTDEVRKLCHHLDGGFKILVAYHVKDQG